MTHLHPEQQGNEFGVSSKQLIPPGTAIDIYCSGDDSRGRIGVGRRRRRSGSGISGDGGSGVVVEAVA